MSERPRRASSRERPRRTEAQPPGEARGGLLSPETGAWRGDDYGAPAGYPGSSRSYGGGAAGSDSGWGPYGDIASGRGGGYTAGSGYAGVGGGYSGHPGQGTFSGAGERGHGGSGGGGLPGPGGHGYGDYTRSSSARTYDSGRDQGGRERDRYAGQRDAPGGYGERAPGGGAGPDRAGYGYGGDRDSGRDRGGDRERGRGEPYGGGRDRGREQPYGEGRDRREHEGGRGTDSSRGSYAGDAAGGGYGGSAAGGSRGYQAPGGGGGSSYGGGGYGGAGGYGGDRGGGGAGGSGYGGGGMGGYGGGGGRGGGRGGYGGGGGRGQAQRVDSQAADQYMRGQLMEVKPARRVSVAQGDVAAVRPDQGCTLGRTTAVLANYFLLQVDAAKLPRVKMHDVVIVETDERADKRRQQQLAEAGGSGSGPVAGEPLTADPLPQKLTRKVVEALVAQEGWVKGTWAYDGQRNLYTPTHTPLPIGSAGEVYSVQVRGSSPRPKLFRVTVRPVADIHMGELLRLVGAQGRGLAARELPAGQAMVDAVRALDVVLKEVLLSEDGVKAVGRGFFSDRGFGQVKEITGGVDLWPGFSQTLHACASGLALLVAPLVAAFVRPKPVPEALTQLLGLQDVRMLSQVWADPREAERAAKAAAKLMRGYQVSFSGPGSHAVTKRIFSVTARSAAGFIFSYSRAKGEPAENISVAAYFEKTERKLRHPEWPCLDLGNKAKPLAVPIELCTIVEGQRKGALDGTQTSEVLRFAKKDPRQLVDDVKRRAVSIGRLLSGQGAHSAGKEWGLSLQVATSSREPELLQADGCVLPAPMLAYGSGNKSSQAVDVGSTGSWNVRELQYLEPMTLRRWCVVSLVDEGARDMQGGALLGMLAEGLHRFMRAAGMTVPMSPRGPEMVMVCQERRQRSVRELIDYAVAETNRLQRGEPEVIFVLLPDTGKANYLEVKSVCDKDLGIVSQCVVLSKLAGGKRGRGGGGGGGGLDPGYLANVVHKVNGKLGGVNWGLHGDTRYLPVLGGDDAPPFMVMGCDVTHPEGGVRAFRDADAPPSVAAVVASRDTSLGRWSTRIHVQDGRQEVMSFTDEVVGLFKELILEFAKQGAVRGAPLVDRSLPVAKADHYASKARWSQCAFRHLPARILTYRDGVSDGEFNHVIREEVKAIREACRAIHPDYAPQLTFAVVKKKHGTRLVAADPRDSDGKGNLRPGTVVDRAVVSTAGFDFFLNSHQGLQGTNRPARYVVLVDEIGFGSNGIQLLTYWMCYTYQRATKAVSVCPPAYYAHLAAFRCRSLLSYYAASDSDAASLASGSSGGGGGRRHRQAIGDIINRKLVNQPFFL